MVFYDGVKFACLSCIRGHRSSNCNHVDRPLMEVRKKGRPVSQCAYCRDLRKTKQIHAKCVCTASNKSTTTPMATANQACRQEECTCTEKARVLLSSAKRRKTSSSFSPRRTTSSAGMATTTTAAAAAAAAAAMVAASTTSTISAPQPPFLPQTEFDMLLGQPTLTQQEMQQEPNEEDVASLFDSILQQQQQQQEQLQLLQQESPSAIITATPTCNTASSTSSSRNDTSCTTATATTVPSFCGSLIPQHTCLPRSLNAPAESVMVTITPLSNNIVPCSASIRTSIVTCYCGDSCTCPGCLVHQQSNAMFETSCPSSATSSCYNGSDDEQCHK